MLAVGSSASEDLPLALVRIRQPQAVRLPACKGGVIRTHDMLDTGASRTLVPLWALIKLGVALDEGSKAKVLTAAGWVEVYRAEIRMDVLHGNEWIVLGVVGVVSPDTKMSRSREQGLPFLLGRLGFFDKFYMLLDEAKREVWLRRASE